MPVSANAGNAVETSIVTGYVIGAVLALLLLAYLVYSLIRPEKF